MMENNIEAKTEGGIVEIVDGQARIKASVDVRDSIKKGLVFADKCSEEDIGG